MPRTREPQAPVLEVDHSEELFYGEEPLEQVEFDDDVVVNATPDPEPEVNDASFFASPQFTQIIQQMVDAELQKQAQGRNTMIDSAAHNAPAVAPDIQYLKHYRCDSSPEMEIVELDMSADFPHLSPTKNPPIRFRRGHFFATTENQVKQIEWMVAGSRGVPDAKSKFGGVVGIYEDSGEVLYYCPYGCSPEQFVTASRDAYNAHLRATHNVEI